MNSGNVFAFLRLAAGALGLAYGTKQCSKEPHHPRETPAFTHSTTSAQYGDAEDGSDNKDAHTSHTPLWVSLALIAAGAMYLLSRKPT